MVFLTGILLSHYVTIQHYSISIQTESASETNSITDALNTYSEVHEDEQLTREPEIQLTVGIESQFQHFQITSRLSLPLFPVWQPPRIS